MAYSPKVAEIFPELCEYGYHKLPIIFPGDLNVNLKSNEGIEFIDCMQDRFGVQLNNDPSISIYIFFLTFQKKCCIHSVLFLKRVYTLRRNTQHTTA
jgi:hypothetical protein